jgi:hypothetical protein
MLPPNGPALWPPGPPAMPPEHLARRHPGSIHARAPFSQIRYRIQRHTQLSKNTMVSLLAAQLSKKIRGGVYYVHEHVRHCGVSRRGRGRQPIRQAATGTAISVSVFDDFAFDIHITVRHHGMVSGLLHYRIEIKYSIPSLGTCLGYLRAHTSHSNAHTVSYLVRQQRPPDPPVRPLPSEQLEQHDAVRVHVLVARDVTVQQQLRSHVRQGALDGGGEGGCGVREGPVADNTISWVIIGRR